MELLSEGTIYQGVVEFVAPFGLFILLVDGQKSGLLRFDQTPYPEIARLFQVGQSIEVIAATVDVQREVVHVQLLPDPTRYQGFWPQKPMPD